jgi:hypothetical protein
MLDEQRVGLLVEEVANAGCHTLFAVRRLFPSH